MYRQFKVTYVPWTEKRGERLRISEEKRSHNHRTKSVTFPISFDFDDVLDEAINILERNSFKPVCRTYAEGYSIVLCDAYGDGFKEVTTLK